MASFAPSGDATEAAHEDPAVLFRGANGHRRVLQHTSSHRARVEIRHELEPLFEDNIGLWSPRLLRQ